MANETTSDTTAERTTARNFDLLLDIPLERALALSSRLHEVAAAHGPALSPPGFCEPWSLA